MDNILIDCNIGVRFNPVKEVQANIDLNSDKRDGDGFLTCCYIC